MNGTQTFNELSTLVDSWGLAVMVLIFIVLIVWPCLPSSKQANDEAKNLIFRDDDHV